MISYFLNVHTWNVSVVRLLKSMRTAIWWVDTCRICRFTVGPDGAASSFCEHTEQNTNSNKHASHLMSKQFFFEPVPFYP